MTLVDFNDWITTALTEIEKESKALSEAEGQDLPPTIEEVEVALRKHYPPSPLLQCTDCKNTESPAGAMARMFNKGRCLHCGGYFKVVRA
jgi:hypothetical protein